MSGFDDGVFKEILNLLMNGKPLDQKYEDHPLRGKFEGSREFHLGFDLVVIYEIRNEILELQLMRIGTHEEVF